MKKIFSIAIIALFTLMAVSCKNANKENVETEAAEEEVVVVDTTVVEVADSTEVVAAAAETVAE